MEARSRCPGFCLSNPECLSRVCAPDFLSGPPCSRAASLGPQRVSITWEERWEEMNSTAPARGRRGPCLRMRILSTAVRGSAWRKGGLLAQAHSGRIAGPDSRGEGASWRLRTFFDSIAEPTLRLRRSGSFQKARGWAGPGDSAGAGLPLTPQLRPAQRATSVLFWRVTAPTRGGRVA